MPNNTHKTAAELLGVHDVPTHSRDRLIETAIDLCYHHGFNAVGLDRIIAEVGITKTTFYKHFESKDELLVEAIKKRDVWESQAWKNEVRQRAGDDLRSQLLALFDVLDVWFNNPAFNGCLFINAAAEFPNPHDPVHQAAAEYKKKMRNDIRDMAAGIGANNPESFADLYVTIFEGTLILRQVHGRNDAAKVSKELARRLMNDELPPVPSPAGTEPG
jgi:AcrR family transcriptional regulator